MNGALLTKAMSGQSSSKYGNKKTKVDGITFDSKHEAMHWIELKYMERVGLIKNLSRQVRYTLIPAQKKNGKVIERACTYVADFVYEQNGQKVVEDAKSKATRTPAYKIKKKLMLYNFGLEIKEV